MAEPTLYFRPMITVGGTSYSRIFYTVEFGWLCHITEHGLIRIKPAH